MKLTSEGDEAIAKRGILNLSFPLQNGFLRSQPELEIFLKEIFPNELRISPKDQPILNCEPAMNPKSVREETVQFFFETLEVPGYYGKLRKLFHQSAYDSGAFSPILPLYANGILTGLSTEMGEKISTCAVYEGHIIRHSITQSLVSGANITQHLIGLLSSQYPMNTAAGRDIARCMKEKIGYVALDYSSEPERKQQFIYDTDTILSIGAEAYQCTEPLFQPNLLNNTPNLVEWDSSWIPKTFDIIGSRKDSLLSNIPRDLYQQIKYYHPFELPNGNGLGIHQMVHRSIMQCDRHLRKTLFSNIVLSGGPSFFPGLIERLEKELKFLQKQNKKVYKVRVVPDTGRKWAVWIGGAIFGRMSSFRTELVSKEEYEEVGAQVIHFKCF